ncbi:MAG: sodium:calcium antiporter, partial [Patescibacteria group bacterium]
MLWEIVLLVFAAVVLARSSIYAIQKLTHIATQIKASEYLVGFIIMAVATSLPELTVGIVDALRTTNPTLSLGNVLGANILNLTLVLGIATLIAGNLRLEIQVRNREVFYMDLIALIPLIFLTDGRLTRLEGVVLLLLFGLYMYILAFHSREYHKVYKSHKRPHGLWVDLGLFALALLVLIGSARVLVGAAESLAKILNMPDVLIGILLVSLSTTLPEMATSITGAMRRQGGLVMGNLIGSVVTNSTLVLGLVAVIQPITIQTPEIFGASAITLVITLIFFTIFVRSQYLISRLEALALILGYLSYVFSIEFFSLV